MNCIIIDDEPAAIEVLEFHLKSIPFLTLKASYRDPLKGLEYLQNNQVDLLFLDINMPQVSGTRFPKLLENPPPIIFTTAYSEYAIESYELQALDYLLKPIGFDRLLQSVLKAKQTIDKNRKPSLSGIESNQHTDEQTIFIKSGTEFHQISIQKIQYVESDGNYVTFCTDTRSILARYKISEVLDLLPEEYFVRIHRSYIVALKYIETVKKQCVVVGKIEIPLSSKYREGLLTIIEEQGKAKS
jgi:two-component system LytT family response regulator